MPVVSREGCTAQWWMSAQAELRDRSCQRNHPNASGMSVTPLKSAGSCRARLVMEVQVEVQVQHCRSNILSSHSGAPQGLKCVPCLQANESQQHAQQPSKSTLAPSSSFLWFEVACLQAQLQQPVGCILRIHRAHEAAKGSALGIGHHAVLGGQLQQL